MSLNSGYLLSSRYKIINAIGSGATADVYEALDIVNNRKVAIKYFKKINSDKNALNDSFRKEFLILASLNHPNILTVKDQGFDDGCPYIVNELINGKTLKDILDGRNILSLSEACDYYSQLLKALSYLHNHGIIHKDIKPQNMFISADGNLKLGDFGISDIALSEQKNDKIIGSVQYISPEVVMGKNATKLSDIYSSGIVMFEMISGQLPFDEEDKIKTASAHVNNEFPSIRKLCPNCPRKIEKIIEKSTNKNPLKRYKNCDKILQEILSVSKKIGDKK